MNIYIITANPKINKEQTKRLNRIGTLIKIDAKKLSSEIVLKEASDADIIIAGASGFKKFSGKLFKKLKSLKFLSLLTVGTAWVDLDSAKEFGVPVSNAKGANSESVAEHIWGMILALSKKIYEFNRDARNKGAFSFIDYQGKEVFGKTLGIIGTGEIGSKVARIASGFDIEVLGINKSGNSVKGIELVDLETLLRKSDIVSVSVPLNKETKNLLNEVELNQMKQDAILVNCAREEIVNKKAVLSAIESGKLFGYGVETAIMEPIPEDDLYFKYKNVIATPHNAFFTEDSDRKCFDLAIENIEKFLDGKPQNIVN